MTDLPAAALPVGHTTHRPSVDDATVDEILALVHACDVATVGFPDFTTDDVREQLGSAFTRPDEDVWLVRDAAGVLVAWIYVESSYGERTEEAGLYVHPEADRAALLPYGLRLLVDRVGVRAAERGRPDHELHVWCTNEPDLAQVAASAGARYARTFARMERALDGTEGRLPLPVGITLGGVDPADEGQLREFHAVYVEGFATHYGFEPMTFEAWKARLDATPVMPYDQWLVARDETVGRVVGVMQAADMSTDGGGWVRNLAVLPSHRGRGVARILLDRHLARCGTLGLAWCGLGVDTQNDTGAYRLYESVGMRVRYSSDCWELEVPATG